MDSQAWDDRYRTEELIWRAEPNTFLVQEAGKRRPGRALDLACGEGRNAVWLAAKGWQTTGVDFSAVGLAKARAVAERNGVEVTWVHADVVEWQPPAGAFDLVIVMYLQVPAEARGKALAHASSAVAPGGMLLVVGHDVTNLTEGTGGPKDPAVLYDPEAVAGQLPGLDIERAERVRRAVATEEGQVDAIDTLVRAVRQP